MRHKIRNKVILFMVVALLLEGPAHAWDPESYQDGITAAQGVQSKLSDPDQINDLFMQPLTSSATEMTSLDGRSTSFAGQLPATQASELFLDLFAAPSATGDIGNLSFGQDTDWDGSIDYSYTVPVTVAGICKNGFISATPGTWEQLNHFRWEADAAGRVTAVSVPDLTALAGCYCINASCGSNLVWNNLNVVLRDLGDGIVDAVRKQVALTVTHVDTTDPTQARYYGQNSAAMGNAAGFIASGIPDPQQYFNGGFGTLPGNSILAGEAADPDSFFSRIDALNTATGNSTTTHHCSVKHQIAFTTQSQVIGYDVNFYIGYDADGSSKECFWARTNGSCQNVWSQANQSWTNQAGNIDTCLMENGCTELNLAHLDDIIGALVFPSGGCVPYTDPISGQTGCFFPPANLPVGAFQFVSRTCSGYTPGCYGSGNDYTHQLWHLQAFTVSNPNAYSPSVQGNLIFGIENIPHSSSAGSCAGLESNSQCVLVEETICDYNNANCVYTHSNYNPTGLLPLTSCHQMTAPNTGQTWTFCADGNHLTGQDGANTNILETGSNIWWNINRIYSCQNTGIYDFSTAKQQMATITSSLNVNGASATYDDLGSSNNSISLPPPQNLPSCEISCVVQIPVQDTQAALSGTTAHYRDTVDGYETVIRQCENNACPLNPGEVLSRNCGCTNYFNQAASMMRVMEEAGKDVICSESPP